jgi:hypothetical protein
MAYGEVMTEILDNIHHSRPKVWICLGLYKAREKGRTYSDRPVRKQLVSIPLGGFGGLEVACWPLVPKFVGSNPAEAVGFVRAKKSSARLPLEGK